MQTYLEKMLHTELRWKFRNKNHMTLPGKEMSTCVFDLSHQHQCLCKNPFNKFHKYSTMHGINQCDVFRCAVTLSSHFHFREKYFSDANGSSALLDAKFHPLPFPQPHLPLPPQAPNKHMQVPSLGLLWQRCHAMSGVAAHPQKMLQI